MVRSELIKKTALEHPNLREKDVERVVRAMFDGIVSALEAGNRVELRGFGSFSARHRDARQGRNPKTGEPVAVEATDIVYFRAARGLCDRLNGSGA